MYIAFRDRQNRSTLRQNRAPYHQVSLCFAGISSTPEVFVSSVVHEAVLEVNEKGAEAAAATAVYLAMCGMVGLPVIPTFRVDRPFLVAIIKGDTVVFFGRVVNPTGNDCTVPGGHNWARSFLNGARDLKKKVAGWPPNRKK